MALETHKQRYGGTRWRIIFGAYDGVERFALDELQRSVQAFLPYVIGVHKADGRSPTGHEYNLILVGTAGNNPLIAELAAGKAISIPDATEGYCVACVKSPWSAERKVLVVAGHDAAGVLYGVEDLCARVLSVHRVRKGSIGVMADYWPQVREGFDGMSEFAFSESPAIARRGIWTWGYVVYDYRRFLDNMARLRMNTLIVWNDCPPLNAAQFLQHAHDCGVKVIMGFHWGWGHEDIDIANPDHAAAMRKEIVARYQKDYAGLDIDGIYFQTLTEHDKTRIGSRSLAAVVADWVNTIARGLYEVKPDLYIQFGLHATSIRDDYSDLRGLDERITVVWEDAGVLPYAYNPDEMSYPNHADWGPAWQSHEGTLEYSKKLATFRPGSEFAMVPKGWSKIRWGEEFEHHGPFIIGERRKDWIRRRLEELQPRWDFANTAWLRNYPLAMRFYREILACGSPRMLVAGLVEDGLFEEAIQPSVALFAQTIWNPNRPEAEVLDRAMSPYYRS